MSSGTGGEYGCTSEWDWPMDRVADQGRPQPGMPGLLQGRRPMQLSIRVPIGPHCNLNPDFKHWGNLYWESYPLPVIHCPSGYGLPGNKLGGSNWDPLYGKLTGYKKSVRHTGTRACLYFSRVFGAPGCNGVNQAF